MSQLLTQLASVWKQLGLNQKISLALAAATVVAVMAGVLVWSSRPDMQLLYGRLDPKDAAEIAAALDAQGIPYQSGAGGTAIHVPRAEVHRARMDMATKGLPTGGSVGFEIFDRGNFGISDFVQRTNYLRAIQGELARTIGQMNGVRSARVMVVMPENRLLVTDANRRSTASVLVDSGGNRLATEAVSSIRSLVANAVEGLRVDDVVVVDNRGNVLSEELRQDGVGGGLTAGQLRYRKSLEDYYGRKVESMLATVLGASNAVVRVSVDVDTTSSTVTEERFDPEGQILRNSSITEDSTTSSETRTQGVVGVAANAGEEEGAGPAAGPTNNSQQVRKTRTEAYEIGRSTISTVRNPGEIRRMTAAVFVASRATGAGESRAVQPRSAEELEALRGMVVNALGVVPPRGQTLDQIVTVQEVDFAPDPMLEQVDVVSREVRMHSWLELGQKGLVVLLAGAAFLLFLRLLKKTRAEAPSLELYTPGEGRGRTGELEAGITPELLNEMIRQKPGNVGLTLKEWMSAEQK